MDDCDGFVPSTLKARFGAVCKKMLKLSIGVLAMRAVVSPCLWLCKIYGIDERFEQEN